MIRVKKVFSVLLALALVFALLPAGAAYAADDEGKTSYTVSFDPGEGSGEMEDVTVEEGESFTLPENDFIAPDGMEFDTWDLGDPGDPIDISGDTTVTALWKATAPKSFTVSFDPGEGSGEMEDVTVEEGESFTLPENDFIAPDGMEFDTWDLGKPGDPIDITADTTVSAIWKATAPKSFTVSFDAGEGSGSMNSVPVNAGDKLTLPANGFKAPSGKEFDKWDLGKPGDQVDITADTTVKAIWKATAPKSFTVSFDAGEGSGSMENIVVDAGDKLSLPKNGFKAPTGKEFDKWDLGKPGDKVDISADTTVKAVWKWLSYTVTFDSDGGSAVAPQTVTIGGKAQKPADPTKKGFTFDSWQTPQGAAFDFGSPVEADITLKAKWTETTFTVSFETDGGSAVEKQTVEKGKTATNPTAPTKKGYSFAGWYSDKECKDSYDFTSPVTADLTLYAKWKEIKYTVSSGANGYYTLKSGRTVSITVKRSEADDTCLNHFSSVEIDGKTLTRDTDYTVKSGSTVVSFKSQALEKLAKGGHTVTVNFDDGKAETKLTIYAEGHSPKTGDENNLVLWGAIAAVCVLGAAGGLILLAKKKRTDK